MNKRKGSVELTLTIKVIFGVDLDTEAWAHVSNLPEALCAEIQQAQDDPGMYLEELDFLDDVEVSGKLLTRIFAADMGENDLRPAEQQDDFSDLGEELRPITQEEVDQGFVIHQDPEGKDE